MDAAGLAVVIDADARAREAGRRLVVRVRSACVRRLLELTRTREQLGQAIDDLRRSGIDRLLLDLRRISFLDSGGLRLILELHAAARGDGFELHLVPGLHTSSASSSSPARSTDCRSSPTNRRQIEARPFAGRRSDHRHI